MKKLIFLFLVLISFEVRSQSCDTVEVIIDNNSQFIKVTNMVGKSISIISLDDNKIRFGDRSLINTEETIRIDLGNKSGRYSISIFDPSKCRVICKNVSYPSNEKKIFAYFF